jgi:hypothetical protein
MTSFEPPPFKPAESLIQLKRSLREMRPLAERGGGFDLQGRRVIEWGCDEHVITVRIARRPSQAPEWDTQVVKNAADQRKCIDEVRKRLALWMQE